MTLVERASNPNPAGSRCQGRVSSMKDSFGFIKRSDVAGEIFFHYSQVSADVPDLREGNDVEFSIEQRKVLGFPIFSRMYQNKVIFPE